jgi:hypothetical protein
MTKPVALPMRSQATLARHVYTSPRQITSHEIVTRAADIGCPSDAVLACSNACSHACCICMDHDQPVRHQHGFLDLMITSIVPRAHRDLLHVSKRVQPAHVTDAPELLPYSRFTLVRHILRVLQPFTSRPADLTSSAPLRTERANSSCWR